MPEPYVNPLLDMIWQGPDGGEHDLLPALRTYTIHRDVGPLYWEQTLFLEVWGRRLDPLPRPAWIVVTWADRPPERYRVFQTTWTQKVIEAIRVSYDGHWQVIARLEPNPRAAAP